MIGLWALKIWKSEEATKIETIFRDDIQRGQLGSPLNKFLIHYLRPRYWFSGHLHVKFEARIVDLVRSTDKRNQPRLQIQILNQIRKKYL